MRIMLNRESKVAEREIQTEKRETQTTSFSLEGQNVKGSVITVI